MLISLSLAIKRVLETWQILSRYFFLNEWLDVKMAKKVTYSVTLPTEEGSNQE